MAACNKTVLIIDSDPQGNASTGLGLDKNVLKNEGLRYTQQRQIIWDEIRSSTEHRDAEEIYLIIKKKNKINVSRATVYRTIDVLVKNNLVRKMELGDGRALYEHKADDEHHDHIICLETGKIIEFVDDDIEKLIEKKNEK